MAGTNAYLSIVTLNTSSPNTPIKRYTLIDWVRKQDPSSCCIKKKKKNQQHTSPPKTDITLGQKEQKRLFQVNGTKKQVGVAIFISDKSDIKAKSVQKK